MRPSTLVRLLSAGCVAAGAFSAIPFAHAQNGIVLTSEGISGDVDKKHRGPVVSVRTEYSAPTSGGTSNAKILVDAYVPNEEYQKYPIRVDYYVNRSLFTSQVRSTELPGPLGIDVASDRATVPFNYTIVATLLHPNREFTTVINGAVFANNLSSVLGTCSLTLTEVQAGEGNTSLARVYTAKDVQVTQQGNNSVAVSFTTSTLEDGSEANEVAASATVTFDGDTASAALTTTVDGRSQSLNLTGTGTTGDAGVESFSVTSADELTSLSCE